MFIFIACAGGFSASMFCQRIVKEIEAHDENLTAVLDTAENVFKKSLAYGAAYDLVVAYGSVDEMAAYNAFEFGQLFDVVFIAPQASYALPQKAELLKDYPTMVREVPRRIFGMMDGPKSAAMMTELLLELDLWRGYQSQVQVGSKALDKDIEIFVAGGSSGELYFTEMLKFLEGNGIRSIAQPYKMETLYDFHPSQDFEIRFVFGHMNMLEDVDFAKVARRIDGFLVAPSSTAALKDRLTWLKDYHIPFMLFDNAKTKKIIKNGSFEREKARLWKFLQIIQMETEHTSELTVQRFEARDLPKRKKLFFLSWEET
jgi:cellobiose-specific phosphotransferase system component IIB